MLYLTTTPGFVGPVAANRIVTADYATMADILSAAVAAGGVDSRQASTLTKQWDRVQAALATGRRSTARTELSTFANQVRRWSGKKVKQPTADALVAYAQLVYTSIGGTGTV